VVTGRWFWQLYIGYVWKWFCCFDKYGWA
jgi:hypothetical protein